MERGQDPMREIVFLIRRLMQAGERYSKQLNRSFNVSTPQLATLLALFEGGPMPASQIARWILVNSSTMTGVVDRLEQKGLVSRVRNSRDRRVVMIELTEEGRRLAENAPPPIQTKIIQGMKRLDQTEREKIIRSLSRLVAMVDAEDLDVETEAEVV